MSDSTLTWDEEFDVVVVGFGGAGACAAIQAAQDGARVLVLERAGGGGATAKSGGVVYLGGGTATQASVGVTDSVESMMRYVDREMLGTVAPDALRAFCESSPESFAWLTSLGMTFPGKLFTGKTTQPPDGHALYFSGNERQLTPESPAPRGHVTGGVEMSGRIYFEVLRKAAVALGVTVRAHTPVLSLVRDEAGAVVGVEARSLDEDPATRAAHQALFSLASASRALVPALRRLERTLGQPRRFRARGGVVLAAGGFMFDGEMVARHAPAYLGCFPLGTPGDDGSGIRLGQEAGGAVASMDSCAATRFHCTPESLAGGLAVNLDGKRFCDESLYGVSVNREITRQREGKAWLVIDSALHQGARQEMEREPRLTDYSLRDHATGHTMGVIYRKITAAANLNMNRRKAGDLADLARACGIDGAGLAATVAEHNERLASGVPDAFGKPAHYRAPIATPPFYAIDLRLDLRFPAPCFTLGGLRIDHATAQVLGDDGAAVPGLYAAGRNAAGICATSYVSGMSLADGVFSGRQAGRHAAQRCR